MPKTSAIALEGATRSGRTSHLKNVPSTDRQARSRISYNHPHPIEVKTMKNMLTKVANAVAMMLGLSVGIAVGLGGILKHKKNLALQKAGF